MKFVTSYVTKTNVLLSLEIVSCFKVFQHVFSFLFLIKQISSCFLHEEGGYKGHIIMVLFLTNIVLSFQLLDFRSTR